VHVDAANASFQIVPDKVGVDTFPPLRFRVDALRITELGRVTDGWRGTNDPTTLGSGSWVGHLIQDTASKSSTVGSSDDHSMSDILLLSITANERERGVGDAIGIAAVNGKEPWVERTNLGNIPVVCSSSFAGSSSVWCTEQEERKGVCEACVSRTT
jgi:hypothetical protein